MLVRQLEDEVVKAKTQASHTNPEVGVHHCSVLIKTSQFPLFRLKLTWRLFRWKMTIYLVKLQSSERQ